MGWTQVLYAKIARRVHQDRVYRGLSRNARLAWLTLLSSDHHHGLPGLWRASDAMIRDELADYSEQEWANAKAELVAAGMLRVDDGERLVWLVRAVRPEYNAPDNPKVAQSWGRKLAQFDRGELVLEYLRALLEASQMWPRGTREAFLHSLTNCGIDFAHLDTVSIPYAKGIDTISNQVPKSSYASASAYVVPNSDTSCHSIRSEISPAPGGADAPEAKTPGKPKEPKPRLPFRAAEALRIIAVASKGRFVDSNPGGQAVEIEKVIREYPDRNDWARVGAHLAAGGESYAKDVLDSRWVTRRNFSAALERARAKTGTAPSSPSPYTRLTAADRQAAKKPAPRQPSREELQRELDDVLAAQQGGSNG